jgi:hypothetical protein
MIEGRSVQAGDQCNVFSRLLRRAASFPQQIDGCWPTGTQVFQEERSRNAVGCERTRAEYRISADALEKERRRPFIVERKIAVLLGDDGGRQ